MNLNLITIAGGITTVIATLAGGLAVLYRRSSAPSELSSLRQEYSSEIATLRDLVATLQSKVEELASAENDRAASPGTFSPQSAININKRTEALRMYKRGGDTEAVRTALGLPGAEAVLLLKVQKLLNDPRPEVPHLSGNSKVRTVRPASR
jgi:hypothetical protein